MKELTPRASNRQHSGQIRRLTSLLKKYQLAYAVQQALLNLSELASTLTDMAQFYPKIHSLVNQHLAADNFFVVLVDQPSGRFQVEYYADEMDSLDAGQLDPADFAKGMTGYVCRTGQPLLCDADKFRQLIAAGDIAQFVGDNGRVSTDDNGYFNRESFISEVSFEASERGYDAATAETMGKYMADHASWVNEA